MCNEIKSIEGVKATSNNEIEWMSQYFFKKLQGGQSSHERKATFLYYSNTDRLIEQLFTIDSNGHMVVMRVYLNDQARFIQKLVTHAMKKLNLTIQRGPDESSTLAVVLEDNSETALSVAAPGWVKSRIPKDVRYEHLLHIPCLLVLTERGRMGNTFPHSTCMFDFRIRAGGMYTTLIQELGRLCRYPDRVKIENWELDSIRRHYQKKLFVVGECENGMEHICRTFSELEEWRKSNPGKPAYFYTSVLPTALVPQKIFKNLEDALHWHSKFTVVSRKMEPQPIINFLQMTRGAGQMDFYVQWNPEVCRPATFMKKSSTIMETTAELEQKAYHSVNAYKTNYILSEETSSSNNRKAQCHYDISRRDGCDGPKRILLKAQCQMGKTGAYLAYLLKLKNLFAKTRVNFDDAIGNCPRPSETARVRSPGAEADFYFPSEKTLSDLCKQSIDYKKPQTGKYIASIRKDRESAIHAAKAKAKNPAYFWNSFVEDFCDSAQGGPIVTKNGKSRIEKLLEEKTVDEESWLNFDGRLSKCQKASTDSVDTLMNLPFTSAYDVVYEKGTKILQVASFEDSKNITREWFEIDSYVNDSKIKFEASFPNKTIKDEFVNRRKPRYNDQPLLNWVFVPSFYKAGTVGGRFDYENFLDKNRRVIVVVRESQFQIFVDKIGHRLTVIKLPTSMKIQYPNMGQRIFDATAEGNGIGFSRLFIQLLAHRLSLDWIFMLDDNVVSCCRSHFAPDRLPEVCTGEDVMGAIELFTQSRRKNDNIEHKGDFKLDMKVSSHAGPSVGSSVGLVGIGRWTHGQKQNAKDPSGVTHAIYSFVCVNIKLTVNQKLYYPIWKCMEDIEFANMIHEQPGMTVLKLRRYSHYKHRVIVRTSCVMQKSKLKAIFEERKWDPALQIREDRSELDTRLSNSPFSCSQNESYPVMFYITQESSNRRTREAPQLWPPSNALKRFWALEKGIKNSIEVLSGCGSSYFQKFVEVPIDDGKFTLYFEKLESLKRKAEASDNNGIPCKKALENPEKKLSSSTSATSRADAPQASPRFARRADSAGSEASIREDEILTQPEFEEVTRILEELKEEKFYGGPKKIKEEVRSRLRKRISQDQRGPQILSNPKATMTKMCRNWYEKKQRESKSKKATRTPGATPANQNQHTSSIVLE